MNACCCWWSKGWMWSVEHRMTPGPPSSVKDIAHFSVNRSVIQFQIRRNWQLNHRKPKQQWKKLSAPSIIKWCLKSQSHTNHAQIINAIQLCATRTRVLFRVSHFADGVYCAKIFAKARKPFGKHIGIIGPKARFTWATRCFLPQNTVFHNSLFASFCHRWVYRSH